MEEQELSVYEELKNMLNDLTDQRKDIQKQIDANNLQIYEANCFADEILSKDEEDFTVFSPRRYEDIYRTQLDQSRDRKQGLENQNEFLREKKDRLDVMIRLLENLSAEHQKQIHDGNELVQKNQEDVMREKLSAMEQHEVFKIRIAKELQNNIFVKLNEINRRIELSQNFFTQDPMRAKLELANVSKGIEDSVSQMTDLISDLNIVDYDELTLRELLEKAVYKVDDQLFVNCDFEDVSVSCETWENRLLKIVLYQFVCKYCFEIRQYEDVKNVRISYHRVKSNLEIHLSCDGNVDYSSEAFMISQLKEYLSVLKGTVECSDQEKEIVIVLN